MFKLLKEKLKKFTSRFSKKIKEKIEKKITRKIRFVKIDESDLKNFLNELKVDLIQADCDYEVAEKICEKIKKRLVGKEVKRKDVDKTIKNEIKNVLIEFLSVKKVKLEKLVNKKPFLIVFFGFNGTGKTTTIAKIAYFLKKKFRVCLAAADTFRAASIEQLEEHAKKLGLPIIKHGYGADPAAVIYDAVKFAEKNGYDIILADTAGRSHTDKNLMEELKKIIKVNEPDLKILILDSLTGSDVLNQFEYFNNFAKIDGVIFTKVDVNEKGGNILSVTYKFKVPILYLGTGQNYEDLEEYNAKKIASKLVG